MYIKNIKTGNVLSLKKIDNDSVSLLVYSTDSDLINYSMQSLAMNNIDQLILPSVVNLLGVDYELSETKLNWLFEAEGRIYRIKISKDLYICEVQAKTQLGQILEMLSTRLSDYTISERGTRYGVTYMSEFEAIYVDIFQPPVNSGEVVLEKLVIDEHGVKSAVVISDLSVFKQ